MCRGIGEHAGVGMLMGVPGANLPGLRDYLNPAYEVLEVPWPANYGPVGQGDPVGSSYMANLNIGMIQIRDMLAELGPDDDAILCGYSGGATLAGNYAEVASRPAWRADWHGEKIAGVGLVADPMRPPFTADAPGFGVGGERDIDAPFPVFWAADPMDPITCLPENSPLRTIADQSWAMSFAPGEFPAWMGDLIDRLRTNRWQRVVIEWWNPLGVMRQYADAFAAADRYLFRGDHTSYAIRNIPGGDVTYLQDLANKLNGIQA